MHWKYVGDRCRSDHLSHSNSDVEPCWNRAAEAPRPASGSLVSAASLWALEKFARAGGPRARFTSGRQGVLMRRWQQQPRPESARASAQAPVAVLGANSTSGPAAAPDFRMRPVPLQDKVKAPPQDAANQSDSLPFFFFGPRFQGQRLPTSSRWLAIRAMASCNKGLQSSRMMSDHPHCQHSARQCLNQTVKHI